MKTEDLLGIGILGFLGYMVFFGQKSQAGTWTAASGIPLSVPITTQEIGEATIATERELRRATESVGTSAPLVTEALAAKIAAFTPAEIARAGQTEAIIQKERELGLIKVSKPALSFEQRRARDIARGYTESGVRL